MSEKQEDANLILRLYELRREEKMRQARDWFTTDFNPGDVKDLLAAISGPHNADYRMVTTYWDMCAAFVNHGAIDEQLFNDIHNEHIAVYAKLEPYLSEFRSITKTPWYLSHLERLIMRMPDAQERLEILRRFMKRRLDARDKPKTADDSGENAA